MKASTRKWLARSCAGVLLVILGAQGAKAQDIPEGVGVADRVRPEFRPVGGRVGSFFLYPVLEASVEQDDNIFAKNVDTRSDTIATFEPSLRVESIWSRHSLVAQADYRQRKFAKNESEDTNEYGLDLSGRFDFDKTSNLRLRLSADRLAEKRYDIASETASVTPVKFRRLLASAGVKKQFGRIVVSTGASIRSLQFEDNRTRDGALIDGDRRDVDIASADVTISYGSGAAFRTFVRGQVEKRSYPFGPEDADFDPEGDFNRDSKGARIEGGVSVELKDRLYGNVRAGYLVQDYEDARLRDISGFSFGADLLWNPSRATSARLAVNRAVDRNSTTRNAGNLRTQYSLVISHELRRYIILTGSGAYARIKPVGLGDSSREREASIGLKYLLNRRFSIEAGAVHRSRRSADPALRFEANRAILRLRIQL